MAPDSPACDSGHNTDWAASKLIFSLIWGLPLTLAVVAFWLPAAVADWLWLASFGWMGGACFINARRCGRVHCHFTAAWLLFIATGLLLSGLSLLAALNTTLLAASGLIGFAIIWLASERLWGRYWHG